MAARARQTAVLWLMRILLVGIIRSEVQNVSGKNRFQPADTFLTDNLCSLKAWQEPRRHKDTKGASPDCSRPLCVFVSLWFLTYVRRNINEGLVEIDVGDRWIGDSLEWLYARRPRGGTRPATHIRQEGWRVFQECYNQHTERSQRR